MNPATIAFHKQRLEYENAKQMGVQDAKDGNTQIPSFCRPVRRPYDCGCTTFAESAGIKQMSNPHLCGENLRHVLLQNDLQKLSAELHHFRKCWFR